MSTSFLSIYEKDGEWCFNTIGVSGFVVPICMESKELALAFKEEHCKVAIALEQALWGVREDSPTTPLHPATTPPEAH